MSFANRCSVTCSGGSSAPWQSKHVFGVWPWAIETRRTRATKKNRAPRSALFGSHVSINGHRKHVAHRENRRTHDKSPSASAADLIKERKQGPQQAGKTEEEYSDDFTVQTPHLC